MKERTVSHDQLADKLHDPSKMAVLSDGGEGAEKVRTFDERRDVNYYTQRIKAARRHLARNRPWLVEVFNLVVKNGRFRGESIAELAASRHVSKDVAEVRYWGHLKKISLFFKAQ